MSYTKTLTFKTQDLGTDATLLLIFDKASDGLYNNKFPAVWKLAMFGASGPFHFTATFSSQLSWLKPATDLGSIVGASAYTPINYNQKTTLQQGGSGVLSFTPPETGTADSVTVVNGTSNSQDVALGSLPQGAFTPVPVYYWNGLGASESTQTKFQPVLRAYITSQYREGEIVKSEIATPRILEQDLSILDDNTTWNLRFNAAMGQFSITQA
ncbi:hypothetical protein L210DRAFT_3563691 [Boletus edulis BED1]|uniref:Uncharacterized protein n=1 Tax=Boletus edulis BED1 TaxID=1328754 RepID=A0AAD4BGM9_BOLED|nr:hypothetical protein L210DRAFT_3563691 [Boletus edulis BED1]